MSEMPSKDSQGNEPYLFNLQFFFFVSTASNQWPHASRLMKNIFSAGRAKPAIARCAERRSSLVGFGASTGVHRSAWG
jgi:hypothetical protein